MMQMSQAREVPGYRGAARKPAGPSNASEARAGRRRPRPQVPAPRAARNEGVPGGARAQGTQRAPRRPPRRSSGSRDWSPQHRERAAFRRAVRRDERQIVRRTSVENPDEPGGGGPRSRRMDERDDGRAARARCSPSRTARTTVGRGSSGSFGSRGGRCMRPASAGSISNATEQAGSMMSSIRMMCTGMSTIGPPNRTGIIERPAMGTWTPST